MEDKIFKILIILVNLGQFTLLTILAILTNCVIELLFLSLIFWSLRAVLKVKHFSVIVCTLLTFGYYALSSYIINKFPTISFMPLLLGVCLIVWMNFLRKKE